MANKVDDTRKQSMRVELSGDEMRALRTVVMLAAAEEKCYGAMGSYAPINQMRNGCLAYRFTPRKEFDPDNDENYQYSLDIIADNYHIRADPRRDGHAGFFFDGDEMHYNPAGVASIDDETLRSSQVLDLIKQGWASK